MKTTARKTRWITAFLTLTLLASLGAVPALAGDPTDPDDIYPDPVPQHPQDDGDDCYPDLVPLQPTDPEEPCVDGNLILSAVSWFVSVAL